MKNILGNVIIALLSALIAACSILEPLPTKEVKTYTLSTTPSNIACSETQDSSLLVTAVQTAPLYRNTKMVYSQRPYELSYYMNNEWITSPADMLFPLIVDSLQNTNCVSTVVGEPFGSYTSLRFDSQLMRFERVYDGKGSHYIVDLRIVLVNATRNEIIASQRLQSVVPVKGQSVYASVAAANHAVSQIMGQVARFCVENC